MSLRIRLMAATLGLFVGVAAGPAPAATYVTSYNVGASAAIQVTELVNLADTLSGDCAFWVVVGASRPPFNSEYALLAIVAHGVATPRQGRTPRWISIRCELKSSYDDREPVVFDSGAFGVTTNNAATIVVRADKNILCVTVTVLYDDNSTYVHTDVHCTQIPVA